MGSISDSESPFCTLEKNLIHTEPLTWFIRVSGFAVFSTLPSASLPEWTISRAHCSCALHWGLQVMKFCKRNVIFQIIPCQVCINDSMSFGNGLFVPHFLICAGGSCDDRICFFLTAFGLALNLGDRGSLISRPTGHIGMGHIFLCHSYHLCVSIPRNLQIISIWLKMRRILI